MNNPIGTIYDSAMPTVIVHQGMRGARGLPGDEPGPAGEQGDSFVMRGGWTSGDSYAPLDAVTWRSSVLGGVDSMYIQNNSFPEAISVAEPNLDPSRWSEVGLTMDEGLLGGVWLVTQVGHPFTKVGQPAALTTSGYQLASAKNEGRVGIAMVREVVSDTQFILQSTGGLDGIDSSVSLTGLSNGTLYYVAPNQGYITANKPTDASHMVNPIYQHGQPSGTVLPWTPVENEDTVKLAEGVRARFYYTANAGQTDFSGPDANGETPDFSVGADLVDCFLNGANLWETTDYSVSPTTLTLAAPAADGDRIEIWITETTAASTPRVKADDLTFDGTTTDFVLQASSVGIPFDQAAGFDVYIDGNPQEPLIDFITIDAGGFTQITFTFAPEAEATSWIIYNPG